LKSAIAFSLELEHSHAAERSIVHRDCALQAGELTVTASIATRLGCTITGAGLLAASAAFAADAPRGAQARSAVTVEFSAQAPAPVEDPKKKKKPATVQPRVAPQRVAPHVAAPKRVTPQRIPPRTVTRPAVTPRTVTRPVVTPGLGAPAVSGPKVAAPAAAPRVVTRRGPRAVTTSRLRGAPARGAARTVVRGQNYSAWRSGYRIRRDGGWRTFVGLGALGAIIIGSDQYYPYAYISAPEPYCQGQTEDGCELMWQPVETEEGDVIDQCVAYCPWQQ
jgi:hypothetical protein